MKYFNNLTDREMKLFYKLPQYFDKTHDLNILRYAIGGLLYIPAINKEMLHKVFDKGMNEITSISICLEDAIGIDGEIESVENIKEVFNHLKSSNVTKDKLPLIFIRFRNVDQMIRFNFILKENINILTGIIIPKANKQVIVEFLQILNDLKCEKLYLMPIIETTEFINIQTKDMAFVDLYNVIKENRDRIVNIRIGVTDILGTYGVRRSKQSTIYDNIIFSKFCADLMSILGGKPNFDIPISGGVSELYDLNNPNILKSYLKEIDLDKLNGFCGKTVIHPLQLKVVQAMSIICYEDYIDANNIIKSVGSKYGVSAGYSGERMNETNPHLKWAKKIMTLSEIYGVLKEGTEAYELFKI